MPVLKRKVCKNRATGIYITYITLKIQIQIIKKKTQYYLLNKRENKGHDLNPQILNNVIRIVITYGTPPHYLHSA